LSIYFTHTIVFSLNLSPVSPLKSWIFPSAGSQAFTINSVIFSRGTPFKTGVATFIPSLFAAIHK